ncbi:hypothetical protein EX30DRAFT_252018 [Ascodesmis nigricans]|uniref:Uncharacterized protein n=1 Tax=Ascodesmis nigricans TaxID=341454 RepID=A0A4S2MY25_9PEZI|nr:hypothetical protein EX30DRAFT_252018 [Ascodesmis nigricans]
MIDKTLLLLGKEGVIISGQENLTRIWPRLTSCHPRPRSAFFFFFPAVSRYLLASLLSLVCVPESGPLRCKRQGLFRFTCSKLLRCVTGRSGLGAQFNRRQRFWNKAWCVRACVLVVKADPKAEVDFGMIHWFRLHVKSAEEFHELVMNHVE